MPKLLALLQKPHSVGRKSAPRTAEVFQYFDLLAEVFQFIEKHMGKSSQ